MDDCCRFIGRANVHMDMESRDTLNAAERAAVVAGASAADMICNFPLWIVAKRLSAGVGLPNVSELYKGSGSLYFAMGPMVVVQDGSTALALDKFNQAGVGPQAALCASAMLSGAVGALAVGAQVEGCITRAHATGETVLGAAQSTWRAGGAVALVVPHGACMVVGREIPYAGCLFFLSGWIRGKLKEQHEQHEQQQQQLLLRSGAGAADAADAAASSGGSGPSGSSGGGDGGLWAGGPAIARDMCAAVLTACVAGPISHAPSVVAAHQQAHAVSIREAVRQLVGGARGWRGLFGGLVPRTASLAGSLFIMPFSVETLQPLMERWRGYR